MLYEFLWILVFNSTTLNSNCKFTSYLQKSNSIQITESCWNLKDILNSILRGVQPCSGTRRHSKDNSEMTYTVYHTLKRHLTLHVSHASHFIPHTETITSQISFCNVWLIWAQIWLSESKKSWLQYYITLALVSTLLCI